MTDTKGENTQLSEGGSVDSEYQVSDAFLEALSNDFDKHGKQVFEQLRKDDPGQYCQVIAKLIADHPYEPVLVDAEHSDPK